METTDYAAQMEAYADLLAMERIDLYGTVEETSIGKYPFVVCNWRNPETEEWQLMFRLIGNQDVRPPTGN